jgi:hypothetical protein
MGTGPFEGKGQRRVDLIWRNRGTYFGYLRTLLGSEADACSTSHCECCACTFRATCHI